ncbi:MAG: tetratricopeptide repeat protein [Candidatus Latescibacterota bacterium]|nr:MAG: tetratricopeptide repeat protein [Candidatus Latescibacterota bacterium]
MRSKHRPLIAICTIVVVVAVAASAATAAVDDIHRARYLEEKVSEGAVKIPVLAQVTYRDALASIDAGNGELAREQLHRSLLYDPDYADVYFTLARIKARALELDAPFYFMLALGALWRSFDSQRFMALNGAALLILVFFTLSLIVSAAYAIKYFPYAAHKLKEILQKRLNAAAPGFAVFLILSVPLLLVPGPIAILAYVTLITWVFMHRRERILIVALITPLVLIGIFDLPVRLAATLSNPTSMSSLIARANDSAANDHLIQTIERTPAPSAKAEKDLALGLLYLRGKRFRDASEHLFEVISTDPECSMAYINLGNVHFLQGDYERALQGYRKAEDIYPLDPVCQFNLAQGYIKTLLMKKASRSLQIAANSGIDFEKGVYAAPVLDSITVLPKRFSKTELWKLALAEARAMPKQKLSAFSLPLARVPLSVGAWVLLVALTAAVVFSRFVNPASLTYQCSNCGRLTCENCSHDDRDMSLCEQCAKTIESVSSERVVEALLRQKRQSFLVRRRKSARLITMILPGVRDVYYERILRGVLVAGLCSLSLVFLYTKGSIVRDPLAVTQQSHLWKTVLSAVGICLAYVLSIRGKQSGKFRSKRGAPSAKTANDTKNVSAHSADAA